MIHIIIGASCSGKSTLLRNSFLNYPKEEISYVDDLMRLTITPTSVIIGSCEELKEKRLARYIGTDRLLRTQIKDIPDQVRRILHNYPNKDIVLEGLKIARDDIFDAMLATGEQCRLYLVEMSVFRSYEKNQMIGTKMTFEEIKENRAILRHLYLRYNKRMSGSFVTTEDFTEEDFKDFTIEKFK